MVGRGDKLQTAYNSYNNRHQSEKKQASSSFLVMKGNNVFKERNAYSGFYHQKNNKVISPSSQNSINNKNSDLWVNQPFNRWVKSSLTAFRKQILSKIYYLINT